MVGAASFEQIGEVASARSYPQQREHSGYLEAGQSRFVEGSRHRVRTAQPFRQLAKTAWLWWKQGVGSVSQHVCQLGLRQALQPSLK